LFALLRYYRAVRPALLVCAISSAILTAAYPHAASTVHPALSDHEYWSLVAGFSEPGGSFRSENLLSNESHVAQMIGAVEPATSGGIYIGVGPEQNFSYIARLRPELAFIVDIRRENRDLHLMYKALFEIAADRAEFVSRLFSRPRPAGLRPSASAEALFAAYDAARPDPALFGATREAIESWLVSTHGFPLAPDDLRWIEHVLAAFRDDGPAINYWRTPFTRDESAWTADVRARMFSYAGLMTMKDEKGRSWSYLAAESSFLAVKDLQTRNLIVPVVGDFAGPKSLRAVAGYARDHGTVLGAFYGSNVPDLLSTDQIIAFCGNLSAMPANAASLYLGGDGDGTGFTGLHLLPNVTANCEVRREFIGADVRQ
jgi:hypothetical protein